MNLNHEAWKIVCKVLKNQEQLGITQQQTACGTTLLDFGIHTVGSLEAGIFLAEITLGGTAKVEAVSEQDFSIAELAVKVDTCEPVAATLFSQYAGWEIKTTDYHAMGSGPMRSVALLEPLFKKIPFQALPFQHTVGVLESTKLPTEAACLMIANKCGIPPSELVLCVAPTNSLAGNLQVVARSLETALHKLMELGFSRWSDIISGTGIAPLPPVADSFMKSIAWTNEAILYGSSVQLTVLGNKSTWQELVEKIPSSSSSLFGKPFAKILAEKNNDFYQIDPMLFGPAIIEIFAQDGSWRLQAGKMLPEILAPILKPRPSSLDQ